MMYQVYRMDGFAGTGTSCFEREGNKCFQIDDMSKVEKDKGKTVIRHPVRKRI